MRAAYTATLIASAVMTTQLAINQAAVADCLNVDELPSKLITAAPPNCVVKRGSLCQDRMYRVEVTNTCQHKIRIYVAKGDLKGEWPLEPGTRRKFVCEELYHQCKGVPISLLDGTTTTETKPPESKPKGKPDPNRNSTLPPNNAAGSPKQGVDYDAAKRARVRIELDMAERINTKEGWCTFLESNPNGEDAEWAKKRLKELGNGSTDCSDHNNEGAAKYLSAKCGVSVPLTPCPFFGGHDAAPSSSSSRLICFSGNCAHPLS
jgi:hypothetical protein